jgi:tRNA A-37 threonylcarbamoyl transferase component Bud32
MLPTGMPRPMYQEELLLGTGGMAEVYLATGPQGAVAVKRLLPHAARNPSLAAAFEREGRLLGRIRHPNVVRLYDVVRDEHGPSLVLEYVNGTDLRAAAGTPVEARFAMRVMRDVVRALEAVHALADDAGKPLGLIHRDLSPSNVLVSVSGEIKLTDFGIARALSGSHATTGQNIKGTLGYFSPEQACGAPVDARSDLFSVAALTYELLTGRPIYDEDDPRLVLARARAGDVRSVAESRPDLPIPIVEVIDRALSAVPADRFPSATFMLAEVERATAQTCGLATDAELGGWAKLHRGEADREAASLRGTTASSGTRIRKVSTRMVAGGAAIFTVLTVVVLMRWRTSDAVSPATSAAPAATASPLANDLGDMDEPVRPAGADRPSVPGTETPVAGGKGSRSDRGARNVGGKSTSLRAESSVSGLLDLGSEPGFAYVTIDGVHVGATPLFGREISAGVHRIEVSREGVGTKTFTIDIHPGQRVSRVIKLP